MGNTRQKTSKKDIGMKIFLLAVAVILVTVLCVNILGSSGILLRSSTVFASDNFEIDGAMMNYYYHSTYLSILNSMGQYASSLVDPQKSLKKQQFLGTEQTWHDYILESATAQAKQQLVLAEAAKAAGMTMTDEDYASIDDYMDALQTNAGKYNYTTLNSFLAAQYGSGVKEQDVRSAMELTMLASKYSTKISDDITITDEEINTYYEENKDTYNFVDLRQFTFSATETEEVTDEQKNAMKADLKARADALAASKSIEEFETYLTNYWKETTSAAGAGEITEENIASNLEDTKFEKYSSRETEQGKWAFAEDRKVGDTKVIESETAISYTVYYLEKTEYRDESIEARNVRHILALTEKHTDAAGAKAEAEKFLAEYEAGPKTEDAFAALATKYSEDEGSNTKGGLYENVTTGQMVEEFENWLFDEARKPGDVGIVETTYGAHVMYYVGEGEPAWKIAVKSAINTEKYNTAYKALEEATTVKQNDGALKRVG